ncbi:cold-shock protein [Acinetobacter bereziniae]|nr:cold shock domain-containing protein [Acinetobacter bereziniae]
MSNLSTGTVKWFNETKGFGFIALFLWRTNCFVNVD